MPRAREEKARGRRIAEEVVVDAYDEAERALGWYYYLEGKFKVPFKARCVVKRPVSPLKVGEEVSVLGMAPEKECGAEMFVWVRWFGRRLAAPLAQLEPLDSEAETKEAVDDWRYWVRRGYQF